MESLFPFPVGFLHPLQHAGLSRRTPHGRPTVQNGRTSPAPAAQAIIARTHGSSGRYKTRAV